MKKIVFTLILLTSIVKAQTLTDSQFILQQSSPSHKGEINWMHQYSYGDYIFTQLLAIDSTSIRVASLDNTETNNNTNTRVIGLSSNGTFEPYLISELPFKPTSYTPTLSIIGNTLSAGGNSVTITDDTEPIGTIEFYAGSSAPTGYLICDGSAVSRTTYSALFAICGTTYGSGDGSTTFNLPDLRQRFPLGKAASGTGNVLGATGGAIDHVHAVDPPNTTTTASGNINNVTLLALGSASAPSHTHDVNIASFNSGVSNPPFLVLNAIIKY